jgi:hypothetical protein
LRDVAFAAREDAAGAGAAPWAGRWAPNLPNALLGKMGKLGKLGKLGAGATRPDTARPSTATKGTSNTEPRTLNIERRRAFRSTFEVQRSTFDVQEPSRGEKILTDSSTKWSRMAALTYDAAIGRFDTYGHLEEVAGNGESCNEALTAIQ